MEELFQGKSPLFIGLKPEEIKNAVSSVPYKIRSYRSGSLIAHSSDPVSSFIMVITGKVKGEMTDFSGRVVKIEDIPAPGALASAFLFGSRNTFPVNVIAVSDSRLLIIEKHDFLKLLNTNEKILSNFLNIISNRSQFLSDKIKFLSFKTIRGKLAQYILEIAGDDKQEIRLPMTQNEMAEFFAVARPSITRVISEMEEQGIIGVRGKTLKIIDKKKLIDITRD